MPQIITHDHNHDGVGRCSREASQFGRGGLHSGGSVITLTRNKTRKHRPYIVDGIIAGFVLFITGWSLAISAQAQAQPDGKSLFEKRCSGCHSLDRDKEGPRLRGVYGRAAGTVESFQYSEALKKSGLKWTDDNLDKWLSDTEKLVPDNDMAFHVEKADERNEIIAYLKNPAK